MLNLNWSSYAVYEEQGGLSCFFSVWGKYWKPVYIPPAYFTGAQYRGQYTLLSVYFLSTSQDLILYCRTTTEFQSMTT